MKNNKLWLIIILNIILLLAVIIVFHNIIKNIEYITISTNVVDLDNNSIVINMKTTYNWKIIFLLILIVLIDLVIFITYKIIEYFSKKYILIITCIVNILFLILFPSIYLLVIIINILLVIIYLIKILWDNKYKNNGNGI